MGEVIKMSDYKLRKLQQKRNIKVADSLTIDERIARIKVNCERIAQIQKELSNEKESN